MSEDFVRCYIGDMALSMLKEVQRECGWLNEWKFIQGSQFNHKESYGYKEIFTRDELLLEAIAKRSVIAETTEPATIKPSFIWNNALIIADALTLLSVARARYYSCLAVEKNLGEEYSIAWGVMTRETVGNWDIVPITQLGTFISEGLGIIESNPNLLTETGFVPSIYWYSQAQVSFNTGPSVLEMALYWVTVEILAGTYLDRCGITIPNKKERVKRFIADKGYTSTPWGFLDQVIDDWYQTRNAAFHEGKQELSVDVLTVRRQQVRDFTSLVLVEMLQKQDEVRKKELIKRIQDYQSKT
jgi:hypothetical protein